VLYVPAVERDHAALIERLAYAGLALTAAANLTQALDLIATRRYGLCLLDLADDRAAIAAIRLIRTRHERIAIAALIDPGNPLTASEALQAGATDLLPWAFDARDIATVVANVRDSTSVEALGDRPASTVADPIFALSPAMRPVVDRVRDAAGSRAGVWVTGESGTGRELIARSIHSPAGNGSQPFVAVDCADGSPHELERRLFGHVADRRRSGDAAGARIGRAGAVFQARGGTLFLTRLAEAPARVQARLSRLLRDREATLVERRATVDVDLRPIATTDPGVEAAVSDGRLRADLFERVAQVRIDLPPLRQRREDIPLLTVHFLKQLGAARGVPAKGVTRSALALLSALPWHGNADELRTVLEGLARGIPGPVIDLNDLLEQASLQLDSLAARIDPGVTLRDARARFERECISAVLMRHHGRVGEAAKALGMQRTNLYRKVRQLNVARSLLVARK
jgi:two-component system response regulator HydG